MVLYLHFYDRQKKAPQQFNKTVNITFTQCYLHCVMCKSLDKKHPCKGNNFKIKGDNDKVILTMKLVDVFNVHRDCNQEVPVQSRLDKIREENRKKNSKKNTKSEKKKKKMKNKAAKFGGHRLLALLLKSLQ